MYRRRLKDIKKTSSGIQKTCRRRPDDNFWMSSRKIFCTSSGNQKMVDISRRRLLDVFWMSSGPRRRLRRRSEDVQKTFRRRSEDVQKTRLLIFPECREVENAHPPEAATGQFAGVSMDEDDEDDEDDPDDDIPLAYRNLPTDYTIDMLAKSAGKSFAVTVAAGNDGCSFTIRMPGNNAVSMPMHFVEVLEVDLNTNRVKWGVLASMCASAYADNEENKQNLL
ncbi:hypothetical protein CYMTET_49557 [Cymbomonas tetramitiformis]|uniref:Uncharacterized protein n=1 Tax=Cymbomonas tetramitiformis TaxID=36881 RepID=A0AAE0BRN4_9CHLO|nr:hypothetical protein CYMTET_49557 [Cymbomonas tetramitiformis]